VPFIYLCDTCNVHVSHLEAHMRHHAAGATISHETLVDQVNFDTGDFIPSTCTGVWEYTGLSEGLRFRIRVQRGLTFQRGPA